MIEAWFLILHFHLDITITLLWTNTAKLLKPKHLEMFVLRSSYTMDWLGQYANIGQQYGYLCTNFMAIKSNQFNVNFLERYAEDLDCIVNFLAMFKGLKNQHAVS